MRVLPPDMAVAALHTLQDAERVSEDGWPTVGLILRNARRWHVPADVLGAMFGLLKVRRGRWIDVARGMHPLISGPPAISIDAETYFSFYRGFARAQGRPPPRFARLQ